MQKRILDGQKSKTNQNKREITLSSLLIKKNQMNSQQQQDIKNVYRDK